MQVLVILNYKLQLQSPLRVITLKKFVTARLYPPIDKYPDFDTIGHPI